MTIEFERVGRALHFADYCGKDTIISNLPASQTIWIGRNGSDAFALTRPQAQTLSELLKNFADTGSIFHIEDK